jgi:hypothetical protein
MDNPTTLLVAIMYVMIISIGLSNLLMVISELAGGRKPLPDRIHLSWLLLLLFTYFGHFWQTTEILDIDNWKFLGFIGFLVGPIILLFATNLLIIMPDDSADDADKHYLLQSNRFFLLMALFTAWIVVLDVLAGEIGLLVYISSALIALFITLAISNSRRLHVLGAVAGWLLYLADALVTMS